MSNWVTILFSLAVIVLSISLAFDVYGSDEHNEQQSPTSWCWIRSNVEVASVVFWQFFCGKFWEITAYIVVSVFYAVIVCYLKRQVYTCMVMRLFVHLMSSL